MLPVKSITSRHPWLTDLLCLSVVLLVCYLVFLGSYPVFTPDEGRYPEVAREMISSGDYITPRVDGVAFLDKPILYYWLEALSMRVFGVTEWALRLFPALFGVFGCLMTYVAGHRLFNRRTGLLSALILATTPLYFAGAHYANLDLEVAICISTTLFSFLIATQSQGRTRTIFYFVAYLFAAFAFLTKGMIGIVFPAIIGGIFLLATRQLSLLKSMHLGKGLLLFTAITLPWYVLVQKANPQFLHFFFVTQQVSRFLSSGEFNNKTPFWFYAPVVLFGFFPWTIFLWQSFRQTVKNQATLFLKIWAVFIFVFFSIPHSKTIGYIFSIFPALALLVGHTLSTQWDNFKLHAKKVSVTSLLLLSGFILVALLAAHQHEWNDLPPAFTPYLYIILSLCVLTPIGIITAMRKQSMPTVFGVSAVASLLFLGTLLAGAPTLNRNSTKVLTTQLKTVITPQDEVVHYFKYFHDVPLYLGQRVTIVADWESKDIAYNDNWTRELWFGMPFQNTKDWLILEADFWQRWNSGKRLYVFVGDNYLEQFQKQAKHYYQVAEYNDVFLVTNQPL